MLVTNSIKSIVLIFLLLAITITPSFAQERPNIAEAITRNGQLDQLEAAINAAGLAPTLSGSGYTLFAPTNSAIGTYLRGQGLTIEEFLADPVLLNEVLSYHVLPAAIGEAGFLEGALPFFAPTLRGEFLVVNVDKSSDRLSLNNGQATVVGDFRASNGFIHIIDNVLTPGAFSPIPTPVTTPTASLNLIETAQSYDLTSFVTTVQQAGLTETLTTDRYTVFAPTNAGFALLLQDLGFNTGEQLTSDPDLLRDVLTYHILPSELAAGSIFSAGVVDRRTVQGQYLRAIVANGSLQVIDRTENTANVVFADINATNGILHVIDRALTPIR
jgi:uncharacterized surface protein with fasciclin (FAS1) repeats